MFKSQLTSKRVVVVVYQYNSEKMCEIPLSITFNMECLSGCCMGYECQIYKPLAGNGRGKTLLFHDIRTSINPKHTKFSYLCSYLKILFLPKRYLFPEQVTYIYISRQCHTVISNLAITRIILYSSVTSTHGINCLASQQCVHSSSILYIYYS